MRRLISFVCLVSSCGSGNPSNCPSSSALQQTKDQVDILFLVDDSPSTLPKQQELRARFAELIKVLDDGGAQGAPVSYHIGVVTSDLGAGPTTVGGCRPGGLGGKLQPLGRAHGANCLPPTGGLNFIDYNQVTGTNNLPAGVSLSDTFACMASVGDQGCGFEHPLEATYRALFDNLPENAGFLRTDALLVVVFVTDEDDCSAPADTDLFALSSPYGAEASFRCSNYGVVCLQGGSEQPLPYADSGGPLSGCMSAPNPTGNSSGPPPAGQGKLFDVSRYVDFYTSIKANPNDVILAALDAPSTPVQTVLGNPAVTDPAFPGGYSACASGAAVGSQSCEVLLGHSCASTAQFFGDPAVRINQVIGSVMNGRISSICDSDYSGFMVTLGQAIITQVMGGSSGNPTGTTGTSGSGTGSTSGGGGSGSGGGGSCGSGGFDNVAACQAFAKKVQCGTTDVSMYVNCSAYSQAACDLSPYFTCVEPKFVCVNGSYDPTKLSTLSDCASKAMCP